MSMHTTQEWHNGSQMNMSSAFAAQNKAHRQIDQSRRAHEMTVGDSLEMYNDLHGSLEQKVRTTHRLVDKLTKRGESVARSIDQSKQSLAALEAAFQAKDAPLQLCMWRMEQREKRPLREQVRDNVETSLEEEKHVLMDTQRRLAEAIKRTKQMIALLDGKLEEVTNDVEQKVQALSVDEMCLRTTHRSWQSVVESPAARTTGFGGGGRIPSAGRRNGTRPQVDISVGSKNEVTRQQEAVRLAQQAQGREEDAKDLREESHKLIQRCERVAEEALRKSERMMQERINENQQMRKRLATEISETQMKIDHTKNTIADTKSQIKALEEPIELTSTCHAWRKQRANKEHILDPVSARLSEHQTMLLRANEELRAHNRHERGILQDLQERRDRLKEDLRDKTTSLHIDLNCLSHESNSHYGRSQSTGRIRSHGSPNLSRNKLGRAMKIDPTFVPMPNVGCTPRALTAR
eukprot:TRINITY_DN54379_c0_g1_i1.p1 TRINITY_DN54379_c0_g1~~TRINITY_DN54379_c0_g1_i1.p1  ORF type:complete len:493 (+),score=122.89 TRINITY_DN54379_c0_g1_i1:89-1480(+)